MSAALRSPTLQQDDEARKEIVGGAQTDYRVDIEDEQSAHDSPLIRPSATTTRSGSVTYAQLPGGQVPTAPNDIASHPALPVVCYCAASISMTVINKFVVSGSHFSMNFLLLGIQSVVCVACVIIAKRLGVITFRDFDKDDARRWFPISFLLVLVIYTGSKSLQFLSIPIYTIFKNLTIILIAYGELLWFDGHITGLTMISFALMVISSLVAAWTDIASAIWDLPGAEKRGPESNVGYIWMLVNCLVSAGYVLAMRKRIKVTNFRDWDTMYYNNLLSIPVLIFFSLVIEDWSSESLNRNFPPETKNSLIFAMCVSGAAAVFISYTTAWCLRCTSSTTFSMVGALNKLPVAASGMIFFSDPVTFHSVMAILIGFVAGLVYSVAKSAQAAKAKLLGPNAPVEMKPR
ncbi:GDP-mannose transporter [Meredithblackwellia eburnea MCA 4105]